MAKIIVHTPFKLLDSAGELVDYAAGEQVVDDQVADHWYTQAHSTRAGRKSKAADAVDPNQALADAIEQQGAAALSKSE
jgi:hypothetical protein